MGDASSGVVAQVDIQTYYTDTPCGPKVAGGGMLICIAGGCTVCSAPWLLPSVLLLCSVLDSASPRRRE
eukprot:8674007-Prorocentrum_lima.AAC.1